MTSPLSSQRVAALRRPGAPPLAIEVVDQTGSTNADLLARLDDLAMPTLLAAEMQTAGRGRAGRSWHTAPGAALTFSLAWKFNSRMPALVGLPLAIGVVIAETLAKFEIEVQLKWPNDIIKGGNKLAGVLIETASAKGAVDSGVWAVIGIGINVAMPIDIAAQIGRPVADLSGKVSDRNLLLAALTDALSEGLMYFDRSGFAAFFERWNSLHAHTGQPVTILDHGRIVHEGTATGVDASGRLLLDTPAGQVAVTAGDVSLRTVGR